MHAVQACRRGKSRLGWPSWPCCAFFLRIAGCSGSICAAAGTAHAWRQHASSVVAANQGEARQDAPWQRSSAISLERERSPGALRAYRRANTTHLVSLWKVLHDCAAHLGRAQQLCGAAVAERLQEMQQAALGNLLLLSEQVCRPASNGGQVSSGHRPLVLHPGHASRALRQLRRSNAEQQGDGAAGAAYLRQSVSNTLLQMDAERPAVRCALVLRAAAALNLLVGGV